MDGLESVDSSFNQMHHRMYVQVGNYEIQLICTTYYQKIQEKNVTNGPFLLNIPRMISFMCVLVDF